MTRNVHHGLLSSWKNHRLGETCAGPERSSVVSGVVSGVVSAQRLPRPSRRAPSRPLQGRLVLGSTPQCFVHAELLVLLMRGSEARNDLCHHRGDISQSSLSRRDLTELNRSIRTAGRPRGHHVPTSQAWYC